MGNMFSSLGIRADDFAPVSAVNPTSAGGPGVVRVAISPASGRGGPRLSISFSVGIATKLGVPVDAKAAVLMAREGSSLLLCSPATASAEFPAHKLPLYTVHSSGDRNGHALRRIALQPPFWCVGERCDTVNAASFETVDGALLVRLPDSFIRPEYLTLAAQESRAPAAHAAVTEPIAVAAPAEVVAGLDDAPATIEVPATETVEQPDNTAAPNGQPAETAQQPEPTFEQDLESLYGALLGMALTGRECPPYKVFAATLFTDGDASENYIRNLFRKLHADKRIDWTFVDKRGESFDIGAKGRTRVIKFLCGTEAGLKTASPEVLTQEPGPAAPVAEPEATPVEAPVTIAQPTKPVATPTTRLSPSKVIGARGRGLSDAERELQEAARPVAKAEGIDEDFQFLAGRGVAIVRNPASTQLPFKIQGTPVSSQEVSRRARGLRSLTKRGQ